MLTVRFLSVGSLKEAYLKRACEEYAKRLSGFCRVEQVEIKETRLPDHPTSGEIAAALRTEGKALLTAAGERSYKIALCVKGTQFSSEELSRKLETVVAGGASVISFFRQFLWIIPRGQIQRRSVPFLFQTDLSASTHAGSAI